MVLKEEQKRTINNLVDILKGYSFGEAEVLFSHAVEEIRKRKEADNKEDHIPTQTEKVKLFEVFRQDRKLHATDTMDVENAWELYGFLKIIIKDMEDSLYNVLNPYSDEEKDDDLY